MTKYITSIYGNKIRITEELLKKVTVIEKCSDHSKVHCGHYVIPIKDVNQFIEELDKCHIPYDMFEEGRFIPTIPQLVNTLDSLLSETDIEYIGIWEYKSYITIALTESAYVLIKIDEDKPALQLYENSVLVFGIGEFDIHSPEDSIKWIVEANNIIRRKKEN